MNMILPDLHLLLLVIEFAWHAFTSYASTPDGIEQLTEIETLLGIIEGGNTPPPTNEPPTTDSPTMAQRRAEKGL